MPQPPHLDAIDIAVNCLALRARIVSRTLSSLYERELRPWAPLKASQVHLLAAVGMLGEPEPKDLVWALQVEKSTLSRNVTRMVSRGWLERVKANGGRQSRLRLTDAGRELIEAVTPAWKRAQEEASRLLGSDQADALTAMGNALVGSMR